MRLLIVEDNAELSSLLVQLLASSGWEADTAPNAAAAQERLASAPYAAVVLDLNLPDRDGLSLLGDIRASSSIPVLVLTARGGIDDRVVGLRSGADDYLPKPFATEELLARIEALLRRPGHVLGNLLRVGNVAVDAEQHDVTIGGRPEPFTGQELRLLETLMRRSGRVVAKKHVEQALFGDDPDIMSNAVDVAVHRLRRRLETAGATVAIHTVRGVGYFIAEAPA